MSMDAEETSRVTGNVEEIWRTFWLPLVATDGVVDMEQVKRELADYAMMLTEVSKVYDELTGGQITKPNTSAADVIAEADRNYERIYHDPLRL